jgi:eukaryotic-like serine/threonine-protein kinase
LKGSLSVITLHSVGWSILGVPNIGHFGAFLGSQTGLSELFNGSLGPSVTVGLDCNFTVNEGSGEILEDSAAETRRRPPTGIICLMGKALVDERYDLRDLVGSGGMADVYLAHDEVLHREVALKLLKAQYAENEEFVERFRREARSAASLSHPHIVPIFDQGEAGDGTYYIAMEYLPGGTLKDRITKRGALPPRTATAVTLQIAEALQTAHKRGVIHRDIKPHNILITDSGHVKVADFGIARAADATTISHPGDILGSAKYMSPEQAMGESVGPASDLYSLGVVLYEMLTGKVPFETESPTDVPVKHVDEQPRHPREVNPEVPEAMDALVMRLLAENSNDRYGSAAELIEELRRVAKGLPPVLSSPDEATIAARATPGGATLPQPAPGGTAPRRRRLSWTLAALVALVALLVVVGGAVGWNLWQDYNGGGLASDRQGVPEGAPEGARQERPGPKEAKVPDVEGLTEQEARERLTEAGFQTEVRSRESSEEENGKVLEQSVSGGKQAEKGSKVLLTVGEGPQVARVPDLVGLNYPEAENKLEESGFLIGGVEEATSDTAPAGVIMKQDPPPGTEQDPNSYVYLTTSVGPPEGSGAGGGQEPEPGAISSRYESNDEASSEEAAVAGAVRSHYEAIGAGNFEEAYSYFGPAFRSQHDQTSWIEGEQSYQIQSSTINSLKVEEVLGRTATATVDVSFVDNTGTPRFVIVWGLVKEGREWKLNQQLSAQRIG